MTALYDMISNEMLTFLFIWSSLLEISLYAIPSLQRFRMVLVGVYAVILGFSSAWLATERFTIFTVLIALVSLYRVINLLRIVEARRHPANLKRATLRSGLSLITIQLGFLLADFLVRGFRTDIGLWHSLQIVTALQLSVALIILLTTARNLFKTRYFNEGQCYADRDLPTVTVAIPARNETETLEDCLRSVLANDYPKLEILVLDDCSGDKTPEIIRQFAQDGVRFIRGEEPKENWLAKNQAYETLALQASGEYILFCGVDVRLNSQSIRALVSSAIANKKDMISVLPKRYGGGVGVSVIQPMRYWWELALPRRLLNRPAVLSTFWLIKKAMIKRAGGFAAVSSSIIPEAFFARELVKRDAYRLARSSELLDVQTIKKLGEQRSTAIRMRYPQFRRRLENVLLISLLELVFLLMPFIIAVAGFWIPLGGAHILSIMAVIMLVVVHCMIVTISNPSNWWIAIINFPVVVVCEVIIAHISMWKYEFSIVDWKGRNVCISVMQTIAHLPKL